jgi:hemerythrin-like domain-containing protein
MANFASDILIEEHKLIKRMISLLEAAADKLENGEEVSAEFFLQAADFIRNFADKCHHAKEEDILFKLMEEKGIPHEGGPIGIMLTEHGYGRQYNTEMEKAARNLENRDRTEMKSLLQNARNYSKLLTEHIYKEDNILYPMGNRIFSEKDQEYLKRNFEEIEEEKFGAEVHDKYRQLVEKWEKELADKK